jgi:hypothetical protein
VGDLMLGPKGSLLRPRFSFDEVNASYEDVSKRAVEFLFETVNLDPKLTLGDVFELIRMNPALYPVYARYGLETLTREALKETLTESEMDDGKGIICLNLARSFSSISSEKNHQFWPLLSFRGIGVGEGSSHDAEVGRADLKQENPKALTRYSLCGCSPASFRNQVLRYNEAESTWIPPLEKNMHKKHGKRKGTACQRRAMQIPSLEMPYLLLGELIQVLVFEFSWFGVGELREQGMATFSSMINAEELEPFNLDELCKDDGA